MKGSHLWFTLVALLAAVTVFGLTALAQESEEPQKKPAEEKPKAEEGSTEEPAEGAEEAKPTLEKRLVNLHKALVKFMDDNRNRVPRQIDSLARLLPEKKEGILNPETGKKILVNRALSGKFIARVEKPELLITFYADKDTPGKGRAVIFADGKLKYLNKKGELERTLKKYQPRTLDPADRGPQMEDKEGPRGR